MKTVATYICIHCFFKRICLLNDLVPCSLHRSNVSWIMQSHPFRLLMLFWKSGKCIRFSLDHPTTKVHSVCELPSRATIHLNHHTFAWWRQYTIRILMKKEWCASLCCSTTTGNQQWQLKMASIRLCIWASDDLLCIMPTVPSNWMFRGCSLKRIPHHESRGHYHRVFLIITRAAAVTFQCRSSEKKKSAEGLVVRPLRLI